MEDDVMVMRRERISGGSLTKLFDNVAAFRAKNRGARVVGIPTRRRDASGVIYDVDIELAETLAERMARAKKPSSRANAPPTPAASGSGPARTE